MKRTLILLIFCIATFGVCYAQSDASSVKPTHEKPRFRFGIGAGVILPKATGPDTDARKDQGFDPILNIGGKFGFEFHIPIYKGLFIKPALYGTFTHSGDSKETYESKNTRRLDTKTLKYYNVTETKSTREKTTTNTWATQIPITIGYSIPFARKSEVFAGVVGYIGMNISGKQKTDKFSSISVSPDKYKESRTKSESSESNPLSDIKFKDKLSYGAGAQVGLRTGKFFFHYTFLYSLKRVDSQTDPSKKNGGYSNELTVGLFF